MAIDWNAWEQLHASLDYAWDRMQSLDPLGNGADREEYASLVGAAERLADRLVQMAGADVPTLDTPAARARWAAATRKASATRELIVAHAQGLRRRLEDVESGLADA
ncbi:MAG: hypothetical protein KJ018_02300 [Burkholderiales bacterium]|nr:hypothetical protein [Burkholderiales bacterium]GIK86390.1 MAG: hypothetical protein BroJett026_18710 [Betaproteobacteria bacterium]